MLTGVTEDASAVDNCFLGDTWSFGLIDIRVGFVVFPLPYRFTLYDFATFLRYAVTFDNLNCPNTS
jgi:hypothetical protein